jgi:hypothetical protein
MAGFLNVKFYGARFEALVFAVPEKRPVLPHRQRKFRACGTPS